MPGKEPNRTVDLEPGHVEMPTGVGVQRFFLRCEGIEQRETGLAIYVLVVPLEQEFDRDGDPTTRRSVAMRPWPPILGSGLRLVRYSSSSSLREAAASARSSKPDRAVSEPGSRSAAAMRGSAR
jgi:hypothetical protein